MILPIEINVLIFSVEKFPGSCFTGRFIKTINETLVTGLKHNYKNVIICNDFYL